MKNVIYTVSEYNNTIEGGNCMKFRNADGTLKTRGYVVTNGQTYVYAGNWHRAQALRDGEIEISNEVTCGVRNIESWNN
jgi:hypothetical protein